jgi:hypothetical protein
VLQARHLLQYAAEAIPDFARQRLLADDLLQLALDDRERRAQLVRCVGQEPARGLQRITQPRQQLVKR